MATRLRIKNRPAAADAPAARGRGGSRPYTYHLDPELGVAVAERRGEPHTPTPHTRHQVAMMSSFGIPKEGQARILRINIETLNRYYEEELETGQDKANIMVARELYRLATAPGRGLAKLGAIKHWLNSRSKGKFNETTRHEHSGPEGTPIQSESLVLTDTERAIRLFQLLAQGSQGPVGRDPS